MGSFQSQLQQLQDHIEKFTFIFSNPVTAVTESQQKFFFDPFKASYSSYRITRKKFLSSIQSQLQQLQNHTKKFLSSFQTLLQQLQNHTKKVSFIFSNPVTAVTESPQKFFFNPFKASYS